MANVINNVILNMLVVNKKKHSLTVCSWNIYRSL